MLINKLDNVKVNISNGHKYAVRDITEGENIIKYGQPIGHATVNIKCGEHVHSHNLKTNLSGKSDYVYEPFEWNRQIQKSDLTFMGYERENGDVGIRNDIWIVNTVGCVNKTAEKLAKLTGAKLGIYSSWVSNGAGETLKELHALSPEDRRDVVDFLREAPLYETVTAGGRDFILTHSGLGSFRKDNKLSEYIPHDLIWTRPSLGTRYFDDITTVFGHTPTLIYGSKYEGKAIFTDTWINIDTGAACGLSPMLLRLDDLKEFYAD